MMSQIRRFLDLQIPSIQNHLVKQLGEALFLIAFFVFTFNSWLGLTGNKTLLFLDLNHFKKICYGIVLICLCTKAVLQKYKVKHLLLLGLAGGLLAISSRYSSSKTLVWIFLFILTAQGLSLIPLAFILIVSLILIGILTFGRYASGTISDFILNASGSRGIRHSMGFTHPNTLAIYLFTICLVCLTLKRWAVRWFDAITCLILALFTYRITGSRTSTICFFVIILVIFYLLVIQPKLKPNFKVRFEKTITSLIAALSLAIAFFSIIALFLFNPKIRFWSITDSLSSGRFHLMHSYYEKYGLTLLGNNYSKAPAQSYSLHGEPIRFVVDNLFARLILQNGILIGSAGIAILLYCEWKLLKAPKTIFISYSLFIIIGLMEALCLWLYVDFFVLAIASIIYSQNPDYLNSTNSILERVWLYRFLTGRPYRQHGRHHPPIKTHFPRNFNHRQENNLFHPAHSSKN